MMNAMVRLVPPESMRLALEAVLPLEELAPLYDRWCHYPYQEVDVKVFVREALRQLGQFVRDYPQPEHLWASLLLNFPDWLGAMLATGPDQDLAQWEYTQGVCQTGEEIVVSGVVMCAN